MKGYRYLLIALALGLAGAAAAWLIGRDPGLVLIERGDWRVETTLAFAVAALIGAGLLLAALVALVRWPLRAWERRQRRRALTRLGQGLRACLEGRLERAANQFTVAGTHPEIAECALLAAGDAARARGDAALLATLADRFAVMRGAAGVATVLRAEAAMAEGRNDAVIAELAAAEAAGDLPPAAAHLYARALTAAGRAREALPLVSRLGGRRTLPASEHELLAATTLAAAVSQTSDRVSLGSLWAGMSRAERARPTVVSALAARAVALGAGAEFLDEVEGVVNHGFSEAAIRAWATMPGGEPEQRRLRVDRWLASHPASPGLRLARARMNRLGGHWAEAEDDARQALANGAGADAWEELGAGYAGQGDMARAARAYANALAVARGEAVAPLLARIGDGDVSSAPATELRNEHGMPLLPER